LEDLDEEVDPRLKRFEPEKYVPIEPQVLDKLGWNVYWQLEQPAVKGRRKRGAS